MATGHTHISYTGTLNTEHMNNRSSAAQVTMFGTQQTASLKLQVETVDPHIIEVVTHIAELDENDFHVGMS